MMICRRALRSRLARLGVSRVRNSSDPCGRAVRERLDRVGKLSGDDVVQRDGLQDCPLVRAQRDPHPLQRLGRARVGDVLRPFPAYAQKRAVNRTDDVRKRDLIRRPGKPETAVWPAPAADKSASAQLGQDSLKELARNVLRLGKLLCCDMAVLRRGELDGRTQRVVGARCSSYDRYYRVFRPLWSRRSAQDVIGTVAQYYLANDIKPNRGRDGEASISGYKGRNHRRRDALSGTPGPRPDPARALLRDHLSSGRARISHRG
jgi:hypothetical protein